MSQIRHGRYSIYIRPISYLIDLGIVNGLAVFYFFNFIDPLKFCLVTTLSWIILSIFSKFYEVYRYTREITILALVFRQMVLFALLMLAYSGFYHELDIQPKTILRYVVYAFILIILFKFAFYYLLQKYRSSFGGNFRVTAIVGNNKQTNALEKFFNENPEYGYKHKKTFNVRDKDSFDLEECFKFFIEESIDEI